MPLRVLTGIEGHMTQNYWGRLEVGYGDSFHDAGSGDPRFQHVIGRIEMGWDLGRIGQLAIGYERDFRLSTYAHHYVENRMYLWSRMRLADRVDLDFGGAYSLLAFAAARPPDTQIFVSHLERTGQVGTAWLQLDVEILDQLSAGVRYELDLVVSNFRQQAVRETTVGFVGELLLWNYARHQAYGWIGVGF